MIKGVEFKPTGVLLNSDGTLTESITSGVKVEELRKNTMAYRILKSHEIKQSSGDRMNLTMDALVSPDNVYATIIQTARASGLEKFNIPFILTNCHNCLCSIGGTINEDDHAFGYSSAKKYGGIFVPAYQGVIHQYIREQMAFSGAMIMGSDSHTRYGALGTMGIGEGGGELVKQLLSQPYEVKSPEIVAVHVTGSLKHGVGPHDVALALVGSLFPDGLVKNKVLEFFGEGIHSLPMDSRLGIDAMTTECATLSSVWISDDKTEEFYIKHDRADSYKKMEPVYPAYYDACVELNLSEIKPMIALPFHPSNCWTIDDFRENVSDIVAGVKENARKTMPEFSLSAQLTDGKFHFNQGSVAGCVGGLFGNICAVNNILSKYNGIPSDKALHIFPGSQAVFNDLTRTGVASSLSSMGAILMQASCGPCFGVQDIPSNNRIVMRHITRNFLNREGARPNQGQAAGVALMDARSIAATLVNGGILCGADELDYPEEIPDYSFDSSIYKRTVYNGFSNPLPETELVKGPNISDWPEFQALPENLLLKVCGVYTGSVTTDELVPSGEASAYRSNPEKLAAFTLQNRDPDYVRVAKNVRSFRENDSELNSLFNKLSENIENLETGSVVVAEKIGDGSAREQAASSQRILGGRADIALEYSTKRFRSNLINWGMLPLIYKEKVNLKTGEYVLLKNIRKTISGESEKIEAFKISPDGKILEELELTCPDLSADERELLLAGCLINFNRRVIKY